MNLQVIRSELKQGKVRNFYIFTGEEWRGQLVYINQIAKVKSCNIKRIESVSDVYARLKSISFVKENLIYVCRDDKEFIQNEKLQTNVSKVLGNNVYILLLTSVDKRTKFYKKYKDDIVEFEHFDDKVLTKYIQKEIDLSPANCKKLIDICESDYGRILLEIDKIKRYQDSTIDHQWDGVEKLNINYCLKNLIKQGVIYKPPKDAIFDFVNAVMDRSTKCWDLLNQSYAVGEANMVLLSVLYNNFKQVLQVQSCKSADISKSTGLTGWQIKCAKEHLNNYSNGELVHAMKLIQEVESGIKTGKIEDEISVQYVLVNVL